MPDKTVAKKYFLTVDWCNQGNRGLFCSRGGVPYSQDHPFTEDEANVILGPFDLILNPQSLELTEEDLKGYKRWTPLSEYSNEYGIARKTNAS